MKIIKQYLILSVLLFSLSSLQAQTWSGGSGTLSGSADKEVKWNKTVIDLGELEYGSETTVHFSLTNISGKPILITNAQGSCGCTNIEYPRRPIGPNQTETVTVVFEADDVGVFNKTVNLTMNIQNSRQTLYIKGVVKG